MRGVLLRFGPSLGGGPRELKHPPQAGAEIAPRPEQKEVGRDVQEAVNHRIAAQQRIVRSAGLPRFRQAGLDQRGQVDHQRKAEQGSMQLQGEVLELALEELLRSAFPFDTIEEVAKGTRGADCMLYVRNSLGQPCGRIIYESKRTKAFTNEWIEKLKVDMRAQQADIAVIDPDRPWIVDSRKMAAAAGNTPFDRQPVQGRVVALFKGGARVS